MNGDRESATESLAELIDYLYATRGIDLSGYRQATLGRRIARRMRQVAIDSVSEYLDHLEVHPEEFGRLFDTILISVTNAQLRDRTQELDQANVLLEGILAGLGAGAVVLDRNLNVLTWNRPAEELWGLKRDEIRGQSFLKVEIGLPVSQVVEAFRSCLDGSPAGRELAVEAIDRRGRKILCRVTITPLISAGKVRGAIMLMDE